MQKQAIIKGPPPTTEEVADTLGLSEKDVLRTREWVRQLMVKKGFSPTPAKKVGKGAKASGKVSGAADGSKKR